MPSWRNALLALLAAGLLILAFPDFEYWFLAWVALVPLMWAVERETKLQKPARTKGIGRIIDSPVTRTFLLGWLFGTAFFFGTCWWLAYAPIHYASIPWPLAYFLIFIPCVISGIFPGIFAAVLAVLLRRFESQALLAAPFVWVFVEFLRYWLTGNNWNALGYSQVWEPLTMRYASITGVLGVSFAVVVYNLSAIGLILLLTAIGSAVLRKVSGDNDEPKPNDKDPELVNELKIVALINDDPHETKNTLILGGYLVFVFLMMWLTPSYSGNGPVSEVVAVQANVPMSGLDQAKWRQLRDRQISLAEAELRNIEDKRRTYSPLVPAGQPQPTTVILPESPMNFMYNDDREFQQFVRDFTTRNNVSLLLNSAEPDATNGKYFNSAVMVGPGGNEIAQYDKIYLLPFGEAVPVPFESLVPAFVGNFSTGREYDLLPLGDAKAGVMICFESHFGQLSREYVRNGADAIIEMTNDGYLGPTPVLRQHLANAVFRAVETNRPVLRVTNVGITAYIDERGNVRDPLPPYSEGTRVWTVSKSDGSQTFYVKYGDWFAWLCTAITLALIIFAIRKKMPAVSN